MQPILLPYDHELSNLYAKSVHNETHQGITVIAAKIRQTYWIIGITRMLKSIKYKCTLCRRLDLKIEDQSMGTLPVDRLKPAPAWSYTSIDLFGPFEIRGEINKGSRGKVYGVIFNCMLSRAVHLDLAVDYSTDACFPVSIAHVYVNKGLSC